MRSETQRWNRIKATLEIVLGGTGQTGLSPTARIYRISDGKWWDGGAWAASPVDVAMPQTSALNLAGIYQLSIGSASLDYALGKDGYLVLLKESTIPVYEFMSIYQLDGPDSASEVWDVVRTGHASAGTFGKLVQVMAGLSQFNHRILSPTYDANGRMLTCSLAAYPSATDAQNQTSALSTLNVTMTYDGDGNLQSLLSRE